MSRYLNEALVWYNLKRYVPNLDREKALIALSVVPTANVVEVKRGKWKHRKNQDRYTCSVCSFEFESATHHCPNCGAKMDGDTE